jgi:cell division protein FtsB
MQSTLLRVDYLVHAYRQAPWRIQRQWLGGFLLAVLGIAMVASLYLDVTAQAAIAGRQIQGLSADIIAMQQSNADLQSHLAVLQSTGAMEQRAKALGYQPVDPEQVQYVVVPGYLPPKPELLTAPVLQPSAPRIPPEYTESLIEWLQHTLRASPAMGVTALP